MSRLVCKNFGFSFRIIPEFRLFLHGFFSVKLDESHMAIAFDVKWITAKLIINCNY